MPAKRTDRWSRIAPAGEGQTPKSAKRRDTLLLLLFLLVGSVAACVFRRKLNRIAERAANNDFFLSFLAALDHRLLELFVAQREALSHIDKHVGDRPVSGTL